MTKEEYAEKVRDIATAILTECSAEEWKAENEDSSFYDFVHHADYDGSYHAVIDSTCGLGGWEDAIDVLRVTGQNPENVDRGLYEGCPWERTLVTIAFEVLSWDVNAAAEEMYDNDVFPQEAMSYPDTPHQKGFFPANKKFKIPDGPWVVNLHNAIKILIPSAYDRGVRRLEPELSVVYEGTVERKGMNHIRYIVDCRRIYNQTDNLLEEDLQRCEQEYGVTEIG